MYVMMISWPGANKQNGITTALYIFYLQEGQHRLDFVLSMFRHTGWCCLKNKHAVGLCWMMCRLFVG